MGCLAPPSARGPASPGRQPLRWMAGVRPSAEPSELNDRHVLGVGGRAGGVLMKRRGLHSRRASTGARFAPSVLFSCGASPPVATRLVVCMYAFTPSIRGFGVRKIEPGRCTHRVNSKKNFLRINCKCHSQVL